MLERQGPAANAQRGAFEEACSFCWAPMALPCPVRDSAVAELGRCPTGSRESSLRSFLSEMAAWTSVRRRGAHRATWCGACSCFAFIARIRSAVRPAWNLVACRKPSSFHPVRRTSATCFLTDEEQLVLEEMQNGAGTVSSPTLPVLTHSSMYNRPVARAACVSSCAFGPGDDCTDSRVSTVVESDGGPPNPSVSVGANAKAFESHCGPATLAGFQSDPGLHSTPRFNNPRVLGTFACPPLKVWLLQLGKEDVNAESDRLICSAELAVVM
jgi:hypothetical protein